MSYAYINTVYPKFKPQGEFPVVNYNKYRNVKNVNSFNSLEDNYSPFKDKLNDDVFNKEQIDSLRVNKINNKNYENLHFYNKPIIKQNPPDNGIEEYTEPNEQKTHDEYIRHVVDCSECRRRLNIELDRVQNDEWIELISYIVFGIFILMLIDSLK